MEDTALQDSTQVPGHLSGWEVVLQFGFPEKKQTLLHSKHVTLVVEKCQLYPTFQFKTPIKNSYFQGWVNYSYMYSYIFEL